MVQADLELKMLLPHHHPRAGHGVHAAIPITVLKEKALFLFYDNRYVACKCVPRVCSVYRPEEASDALKLKSLRVVIKNVGAGN